MKSKLGKIFLGSAITILLVLAETAIYKTKDAEAINEYPVVAPGSLVKTNIYNGYDANSQRKLARTSDGRLHAVYSRSNGIRYQIYHSYSSDNGENWTEESLTSETCGNQLNPAIIVDSNNYLHIVWEGCSSDSLEHSQIRYRKYTSSWSGIVNITNDTNWNQRLPVIAIDSNDNLHLVWQKIDFIGVLCSMGCGPIYYSAYNKTTNLWDPAIMIGEGEQYEEINPVIAINKNNNINIAWMSGGYRNKSCWSSVYRKYTDSWQPFDRSECLFKFPSIATDSKGDVHLVASKLIGNDGVFVYSKNGWTNPQEIINTGYGSKLPSISADGSDYLHIVWSDEGSIKHIRYTSSWQLPETLISDTDSVSPSLIWAWNPTIDGERTNISKTGYAFVWNDGENVKFYKSKDLKWGTQLPEDQPLKGIDISSYAGNISMKKWNKLFENKEDYKFVIVGDYGGGTNPYAQSQLQTARCAGFKTALYEFLRYDNSSLTGDKQVNQVLNHIGDEKNYLSFFALDIEPDGLAVNVNVKDQIQNAVNAVTGNNLMPIIYTQYSEWYPSPPYTHLFLNNTDAFKNLPLWDAHPDGLPSLQKNWGVPIEDCDIQPDRYNNYCQKYGGWEKRTGKQYYTDLTNKGFCVNGENEKTAIECNKSEYGIWADLDSFKPDIFFKPLSSSECAIKETESYTKKGYVDVVTNLGAIEKFVSVEMPPEKPFDANLPYGLFRFEITGLKLGDSATITFIYPLKETQVIKKYWKYGRKTSEDIKNQWYAINSDIKGNRQTITLIDGGLGDDDFAVNGKIVDDGGPQVEDVAQLDSQIYLVQLFYGGTDILTQVTQSIGDKQAPLLLSELKESQVDLEDYTSDGKLNPGQKKKLKMKFKFLETAGNEYQGKSINVNFKFLATQEER